MVSDQNYPAPVLHRQQSPVKRQGGRIRLCQDDLPVGWRIGGNRHDGGSVPDINADVGLLRPFPAEGVEQRRGQRAATGRIHHQIGLQGLRPSRPEITPNTVCGSTTCRGHDLCYPATRPQRYVGDRLSPTSQHDFDQRSGRTEHRYAEVALWQYADIRPLILQFLRDPHGDSSGSGEITLEARENLPESPEAACQQTMRVPVLSSAGPRTGRRCQAVAFQNDHPLEVLCQCAGHR